MAPSSRDLLHQRWRVAAGNATEPLLYMLGMVLTFCRAAKIVLFLCKLQLAAIWRRAWDFHYRKQLELICNLAVAEEQGARLHQAALLYWRRLSRLIREKPRWVDFPSSDHRPYAASPASMVLAFCLTAKIVRFM